MAFPLVDPEVAEREKNEFLSKDASQYAATIVNRVLEDRDPCVLMLPTGAGKSTVIPYAFIQAGQRIMVSEPTVAMCENVVQSFAAMFPSVIVGKSYGREVDIPKGARLIVCTNGNLKARLLGGIRTGGVCTSINYTDIIMLDEVHMGKLETHVIVSLWYHCAIKYVTTARMPRLLLSSATVGDSLFSRAFSPCVVLPEERFKPPFPIQVLWASKDYGMRDASRFADMGALIKSIHESTPISERILGFVPGMQEMAATIQASGLRPGIDIEYIPFSKDSKSEDLVQLFRTTDKRRLVVLATPVADAGLTVINLIHVIDSMQVKNPHVQANGVQALVTEVASKQLSRQRMGRVGRKAPGMYYPMCTEEFYNSDTVPVSYTLEINRMPLYKTIVELVAHGVPVEETLAIYNIPTLGKTIDELLSWGLLRRSDTSGELFASSGGNFMSEVDLDSPQLSGVLFAWLRLGMPIPEGVALIHLIGSFTSQMLRIPNFQPKPGESRGKMEMMKTNFIRKKYGRFLGPSDVHTAIRIWNSMLSETTDPDSAQRWCIANALQWSTVKNVIKSIEKTVKNSEREVHRLANQEAVAAGGEITPFVSSGDPLVILSEKKLLPTLRRLMEHIYYDKIATRSPGPRAVFVLRDGTTVEPPKTNAFTLQGDPDASEPYPMRIVILDRRSAADKQTLSQFLDVDNSNEIATISTELLNEKLGIFVNRFPAGFGLARRSRSKSQGRVKSRARQKLGL